MDDRRVGRALQEIRIHLGWRQLDLADRSGISQRHVAEIERGRLEHVSLGTLRRVANELDVRASIDVWWRSGRVDHLLDRAHAALVEHTARHLRDAGWEVRIEYGFNEFGDRGSADVIAWHAASRTLAIIEVKSRIDDVQEACSTFMRKVRIIPRLVARDDDWTPARVVRMLVIADTRQNRDLVATHRNTLDTIWPERTAATTRLVRDPGATSIIGGIWFVPMARLPVPVRTAARVRRPRSREGAPTAT